MPHTSSQAFLREPIRSDDTPVVSKNRDATEVPYLAGLSTVKRSRDAELPDHFTAKPGFFLTQVVGETMNRSTAMNPIEPILSFSS